MNDLSLKTILQLANNKKRSLFYGSLLISVLVCLIFLPFPKKYYADSIIFISETATSNQMQQNSFTQLVGLGAPSSSQRDKLLFYIESRDMLSNFMKTDTFLEWLESSEQTSPPAKFIILNPTPSSINIRLNWYSSEGAEALLVSYINFVNGSIKNIEKTISEKYLAKIVNEMESNTFVTAQTALSTIYEKEFEKLSKLNIRDDYFFEIVDKPKAQKHHFFPNFKLIFALSFVAAFFMLLGVFLTRSKNK